MMALNSDLKSREVKVLNRILLDPEGAVHTDAFGNNERHDPDVSNPGHEDTDITKPVERDLYDDFYQDDNPDDPDPGLYQINPNVKKKDINKRAGK
ncbi:MAG: hypothetical protein ACAH08_07540 [Methylophilus sp.]